jgi:Ca2+-binding RTX toxin-like protein
MAIIWGTNNSETINASDGMTTGDDMIYGYDGDDTINALGGDDIVWAGDGNDDVFGGDGNDDVFGGEGYDDLFGEDGDDELSGGALTDYLFGGDGADELDGGDDFDYAFYFDSTAGVTVDLETGLTRGGDAQGDTLTSIEGLAGSAHDDTFVGNSAANELFGLDGDDTLKGGGGADELYGDDGNTGRAPFFFPGDARWILYHGATEGGDDTLYGDAGNDFIYGGRGNDLLKGGGGADILNGGDDNDTATYSDSPDGVNVSLSAGQGSGGDAEGDELSNIESLTGSNHADQLGGDGGANELHGLAGNDELVGLGGDDKLDGGDNDDTLKGFGGADILDGGSGSDTASYDASPSSVVVSLLADTAAGGDAQDDTLISIENLTGSIHDDWLEGDNGANVLDGGAGSDTLKGFGGGDHLIGGTDNDTLTGGAWGDTLDGGEGIDTATYVDADESVRVSLIDHTASEYLTALGAPVDTLIDIENVTGSAYRDWLYGDDNANELDGRDGNDTLEGAGNDDILYGRNGNDTLAGGGGGDVLKGGEGSDTADYAESAAGVTVSLIDDTAEGGDADGDELDGIENLTGSAYADTLRGDSGANFLAGLDGNNTLYGYGGGDDLWGGNDTDTLFGMGGIDILKGFGGDDTLDGGANGDTMLGGFGDDTFYVDNTADVVTEAIGEGILDRVKTSVTYSLTAGSEVEILETTDQAGTTAIDLVGNEFDNTIIGNDGQNTIVGSSDTDGGGYDGLETMTGLGGGDTFVWTSTAETGVAGNEADVVTDFDRAAGDLLAFNQIDADATGGTADDAFTFIGTAAFTAPGQINYFSTATDTFILLNTDADATQEATIRVAGVHTVDASWFVL